MAAFTRFIAGRAEEVAGAGMCGVIRVILESAIIRDQDKYKKRADAKDIGFLFCVLRRTDISALMSYLYVGYLQRGGLRFGKRIAPRGRIDYTLCDC